MKIFSKEGSKEVVYIQYKDLKLLSESAQIPKDIKNKFPQSIFVYIISNEDKYFKFDDPVIVEFMKKIYYIVDFNKFKNLSQQEIFLEYKETRDKIKKIENKLNHMSKKQRKNQKGLYDAYYILLYYEKEIINFLKSNIYLPNGIKYTYKNNG